MTLNKLIFTKLRGKTVAVLASPGRILQIEAEPEKETERLGAIYIGKVRNIVKNLGAAFVEYQPGVNGYLSLSEWNGPRLLRVGDEIPIQVTRAAVKTKDAVLSTNLCLTGHYVVLTSQAGKLGISAKIRDGMWRTELKAQWESRSPGDYGLIVRTNAYTAPFETIWEETDLLRKKLHKIHSDTECRTCYSTLYEPESFVIQTASNVRKSEIEEIVTDIPEIYEELRQSGLFSDSLSDVGLRLYSDKTYPLRALYHLETALDHALSRQVWLKSGGYLVIDPTEAMTVIDVNTGKNVGKKTASETYFNTNLEAASEIAAQLRLRNLSGIILVDFIDMEAKEQNKELLSSFRKYLAADPVKTVLVDMTALGLVEITRKKIKRPLHEQFLTGFSEKTVDTRKT